MAREDVDVFGALTYLIWLAVFVGLPVLALLRWGAQAGERRRALLLVMLGSLAGGWLWDALSVRLGIWFYAPANILGVWLAGLPLEEWLWIGGVTLMFGLLTVALVERAGPR